MIEIFGHRATFNGIDNSAKSIPYYKKLGIGIVASIFFLNIGIGIEVDFFFKDWDWDCSEIF